MIKNKKAQGLSISAIIIAVLALLVLVVLALIFTGSLGDWANRIKIIVSGQKTCGELGGDTIPSGQECPEGTKPYLGFVKPEKGREGYTCCLEEE